MASSMEQGDWQGYINRYSGSAPPAPQAAAPPRISLFVQLTDTTSSERTQQVAQDPALYDSNGSPSPKRSKPAEPLASQESPLQAHGGQAPALPDDGGGACAAAVALQRLEGAAAAARAPESNRPPDKAMFGVFGAGTKGEGATVVTTEYSQHTASGPKRLPLGLFGHRDSNGHLRRAEQPDKKGKRPFDRIRFYEPGVIITQDGKVVDDKAYAVKRHGSREKTGPSAYWYIEWNKNDIKGKFIIEVIVQLDDATPGGKPYYISFKREISSEGAKLSDEEKETAQKCGQDVEVLLFSELTGPQRDALRRKGEAAVDCTSSFTSALTFKPANDLDGSPAAHPAPQFSDPSPSNPTLPSTTAGLRAAAVCATPESHPCHSSATQNPGGPAEERASLFFGRGESTQEASGDDPFAAFSGDDPFDRLSPSWTLDDSDQPGDGANVIATAAPAGLGGHPRGLDFDLVAQPLAAASNPGSADEDLAMSSCGDPNLEPSLYYRRGLNQGLHDSYAGCDPAVSDPWLTRLLSDPDDPLADGPY